jgi:hypothetical protein
MRRAHDPAGLRGRRLRLRRHAQHQAGDAGGLGCQRQLAARDEIELPRLAPDFQHHRADRIAGQRVGRGAQRRVDIGRAHRHQPARIEAEFGQPAHRQRAGFKLAKILPHPHQRTPRHQPPGKARDQPGGRPALPSLGEHFMHRPGGETAAQTRIGAGMTERHLLQRMGIAIRFKALDAAAQTRKRVRACTAHAAPGEIIECCRLLE